MKDHCVIYVDKQFMEVECQNGFKQQYIISTAANCIGNEAGSFKTPLGKHIICEKIGDSVPTYTIFKSRKYTGNKCEVLNNSTNEDLILTRILRLKGEEFGLNLGISKSGKCVDSYQRYIYIHGTNREDLLGTPSSNGCIRMANKDIEELFFNIQLGAIVDIRK